MAILLFSRRGIHYHKGSDRIQAIYIPNIDQIQTYRENGSNSAQIATRAGIIGRQPLWRNERSDVKVYGELPTSLFNQRKALQVWLASDFVPVDADAFFFIFNQMWVIHGTKHMDDERKTTWRTALLEIEPEHVVKQVAHYAADVMLDDNRQNICIAVDGKLQDYEAFKEALAPLNIIPQPFSMLKITTKFAPLYKHNDFSLFIVITIILLSVSTFITSIWWLGQYKQVNNAQERVAQLGLQIAQVQSNQKLGYIQNPQEVLDKIKKTFNQQPSAVIDAAGRFASIYGDLSKISFSTNSGGSEISDVIYLQPSNDMQQVVMVNTSSLRQKLLAEQEKVTQYFLKQTPWIRQVANIGMGENMGQFQILLQIDSSKQLAIPSSTTPAPTLITQIPSIVSPDAVVSPSITVSPSQVSPSQVSPSQPAAALTGTAGGEK
jgi:hypothetical protein